MNRKLLALLNQINEKKLSVQNLVEQGKLEDAAKEKEELVNLQKKFDILKDVMDSATEGLTNGTAQAAEVRQETQPPSDAAHEFAQAVRTLQFRNMNNENGSGTAGNNEDGGYTVPEDIRTMVERWKENHFSLENLVSVESVNTLSGRRTYMKRSQHTGFSKVSEAGKIGAKTGPKFEIREYKVEKYGGYLPVTNELLEDSDANITGILVEWMGEEDIATRNSIILAEVDRKGKTPITGLDDIKKAINVTLGQAFAATSAIVTNDDGFNWMDTLKEESGSNKYLLKPNQDQTSPIRYTLAVGARVVPVVVVPNEVLASAVETKGEGTAAVTTTTIPFIIGDLKEYCKIFDRKRLTLLSSNIATAGTGQNAVNAFEEDLTLIRGIERLDCVVLDSSAIVYGRLTIEE